MRPARRAGRGRSPGAAPGRATAVAATVLFVSFLDVFALLPTVAPHAEALGAGPALVGLTVGAYSAGNLPANVLGGVLVDRWGRRRVVLLGLALAALAVAAYPLPGGPAGFVAVRTAHGLAGGLLLPAVFALAGDRARPGSAGRLMGRMGAVIGAAAVLAPAGAGLGREAAGTTAVFLAVAGVLALGWLLTWVAVPGPGAPAAGDDDALPSHAPTAGQPATRIGDLLADGGLRRALVATVAMTAAAGVLAGFLPSAAEERGAEPSVVGALFTVYALVAGAVMLSPLAGRVDRRPAAGTPAVGLAVLALGLAGFALAPGLPALGGASAVFGLGYGLVFPAVSGVTSLVGGPGARGRAFGLFNAAFSVGLALGPSLVGALTQRVPGLDPFATTGAACGVIALGLAARAGAWRPRRPGRRP